MPWNRLTIVFGLILATCALATASFAPSAAAEEPKVHAIKLGKLQMTAPADWDKKTPSVRIIAYEFSLPPAEKGLDPGRMTIMSAGGSIEANLDRWYGQFRQEDGGDTAKAAKTEKKEIAGQTVHLVEITGTFKDQRGPFSKAEFKKDYEMFAAIIETGAGNIFVKTTAPKKTMAKHKKAIRAMIEGLK